MGLVSTLSLYSDPGARDVLGELYERFPAEYVSMLPVAVEAMGMLGYGTAGADVKGVVLQMLSASLRSSRAAKYLSEQPEDVVADHLYTLSQAYRQALAHIEPDKIRWALDPVAQKEAADRWAAGVPALMAALEVPLEAKSAEPDGAQPGVDEQAEPAPTHETVAGRRWHIRHWIARRRHSGTGRH